METLARVCKANNITPSDTNFMALVVKVCCTKFGISPRASKEYAQTLVVAYRTDKWKTYLDEEEAVKEPESVSVPMRVYSMIEGQKPTVKEIIASIKPSNIPLVPVASPRKVTPDLTCVEIVEPAKPSTREILAKMKPSGEPVLTMPPRVSTQLDKLPDDYVAQIFYRIARIDTVDNVGRILLSEARKITDNKYLSREDVTNIWRSKYPMIDIDLATANVLLIYWGGKENTLAERRARAPIIPKRTPFIFQDREGVVVEEVIEDDEGVVDETGDDEGVEEGSAGD